jgi:hypothetical protein
LDPLLAHPHGKRKKAVVSKGNSQEKFAKSELILRLFGTERSEYTRIGIWIRVSNEDQAKGESPKLTDRKAEAAM